MPSKKSDTPPLIKHSPASVGKKAAPAQPKVLKHSPASVSGHKRKGQHPMDQRKKGR